jgi:preprotein translocase subunit SecA
MSFLKNLFGSRNQRVLSRLGKRVEKINRFETKYKLLTDMQLKAKTESFKQQLADGVTLDKILEEAFACVREASIRVFEMRHFDVQLIGGMVLHSGQVAEMCTGEGKTLAATLPIYLNALMGKGVHLVTVNDYLAKRDGELMGQLYEFLGLSIGVIVAGMDPADRKKAYEADITYGTNNEFGFDYLRDNMAFSKGEQVQRPLNYAIVDEVDSILIDEARTPLIISGEAEGGGELYLKLNDLIPSLELCDKEPEHGPLAEKQDVKGDYYLDLKSKQAYLTDDGHQKVEDWMLKNGVLQEGQSLYDSANINLMHYFNASLRAHTLYKKDVDYMQKDGQIMIVDEHTGRAMEGRRWSDGLHQAMEAKEGVEIQKENQTMASITYQNYFRLYEKLSGMTGTADTEAFELHQTYGLEVVVIPTNKPLIRKDNSDLVYMTEKEKFKAIIDEIKLCHDKKQPVLVGTASIDTSERLSFLLKKTKIKHEVLNAKQHEREADIIAQAGSPGQITIATNMAGRGTDIVLGGSWQAEIEALEKPTDAKIRKIKDAWQKRHDIVLEAGGLIIIGSERHESRRIDNQLRGRAGRQGDPGASRFFLSLDDQLVKIFASERMIALMRRLNIGEGEAIESRMVSNAIAKAQKKVEQHYFDMRKQLLEYDDVANSQRTVIYDQRNKLLVSDDVSSVLNGFYEDVVTDLMNKHVPMNSLFEQWDLEGLTNVLSRDFDCDFDIDQLLKDEPNIDEKQLYEAVLAKLQDEHEQKRAMAEEESFGKYEKVVILHSLDTAWREHLSQMDYLRSSIGLRGYAQKDPKQEYKKEAFRLFEKMLSHFKYDVISSLAKLKKEQIAPQQVEDQWRGEISDINYQHQSDLSIGEDGVSSENNSGGAVAVGVDEPKPFVREGVKVGRNDPCHCGSGKKYKQCHGKIT